MPVVDAEKEDYKYDVFLSYKRPIKKVEKEKGEDWLDDIFMPLFRGYLSGSMPREPKIFIDKENIPAGVDWPNYLVEALSKSKCLIAILSKPYTASLWCMREYEAMRFRQEQLRKKNLLPIDYSIVIPIVKQWPPDDPYPSFIDRIQLLDYSQFNKVGQGFRDSKEYNELQDKILHDVNNTLKIINNPPAWSDEFARIEWLNGNKIEPIIIKQSQPTFQTQSIS